MPPLLAASIRRLAFAGGRELLRGVDLALKPGEVVRLSGPPESGKSALCQALAGVIPARVAAELEGEVRTPGGTLSVMEPCQAARWVSLVAGDAHNQLFCASVEEDLWFGPGNLGLERGEIARRAGRALAAVGLAGFGPRQPETLSGGETQRAALASFLAMDAPVLILDRALGQMDPPARRRVLGELGRLAAERGKAVLLADDSPEAAAAATRSLRLAGGRLLPGVRPAPAPCPGPLPPPIRPTEPLLEARNLGFAYDGGRPALEGVSLSLGRGDLVALTGGNGAGKTTLAKLCLGLLRPGSGTVRLAGHDPARRGPAWVARRAGLLFQHPDLTVCRDTVRQEVGFGLCARGVAAEEAGRRVQEALELVELSSLAEVHPFRLGRAQLVRMALAGCLAAGPELLILDEPSAHLGPEDAGRLLSLLGRLNARGLTMLVISHDLNLARSLCRRELRMEKGRLLP